MSHSISLTLILSLTLQPLLSVTSTRTVLLALRDTESVLIWLVLVLILNQVVGILNVEESHL